MSSRFESESKIIVACCSGNEQASAISVLRISGKFSLSKFQHLFSRDLKRVVPRVMTRSFIVQNEKKLDDVCLCYYPGPNSFTGEDVLEIFSHGNPLIVDRIGWLFANEDGVRHAKEGEFSLRAFRNGKMSLSQAEGLSLLLSSKTEFGLSEGQSLLYGELSSKYLELYDVATKLLTSIEIMADFSEDVGDEQSEEYFQNSLVSFERVIVDLNRRAELPSSDGTSIDVVFTGPVNAGKSTLFNNFLGNNRSIVSEEKGTTRDYINSPFSYKEILFNLIDTAGLRVTANSVEQEGIDRAKSIIKKSFYKIGVCPFHDRENYQLQDQDFIVFTFGDKISSSTIPLLPGLKVPWVVVATKETGPIEPIFSSAGPIEPHSNLMDIIFRDHIVPKVKDILAQNPISLARHRELIRLIHKKWVEFKNISENTSDLGILSSEIIGLKGQIEELTGQMTPDDILNKIFSTFCIGK